VRYASATGERGLEIVINVVFKIKLQAARHKRRVHETGTLWPAAAWRR